MTNHQRPNSPININIGSLIPKQGEKTSSKLKPVQPDGIFDIPSGLDGALAWSLSWVCLGGLFVPLVKLLDRLDLPPIIAPVIGLTFVTWLLLEVARSPRIEVGVALGCVVIGAFMGVVQ